MADEIVISIDAPDGYEPYNPHEDDPTEHRKMLADLIREALSADDFTVHKS